MKILVDPIPLDPIPFSPENNDFINGYGRPAAHGRRVRADKSGIAKARLHHAVLLQFSAVRA